MNFIIPYYTDERLKYTQKYLENAGHHEVFDKNKADFAVFSPACDKEKFKGYEIEFDERKIVRELCDLV